MISIKSLYFAGKQLKLNNDDQKGCPLATFYLSVKPIYRITSIIITIIINHNK